MHSLDLHEHESQASSPATEVAACRAAGVLLPLLGGANLQEPHCHEGVDKENASLFFMRPTIVFLYFLIRIVRLMLP
jgi:hypothetical protein